jgi:alpha-1,3-glucan synthase
MDCDSVTQSLSFTLASSRKGSTPSVKSGSVQCLTTPDANIRPASVLGATVSRWYWKATINNVADGILTITVKDPQNQSGVGTGVGHFSVTSFVGSILTITALA